MDGMGSPDSLMEHSMLDIKNSSPYACYSSPKLSYDVFPSNRGKLTNNNDNNNNNNNNDINTIITNVAGLNLGGIKNEALWHLNQNYAGYGGSPGHYGLSSPNIASNAVI